MLCHFCSKVLVFGSKTQLLVLRAKKMTIGKVTSVHAMSTKVGLRFSATLDPKVERDFEDGLRAKHHPGIRHIGCVEVPQRLQKAASAVLRDYDTKHLDAQSAVFVRHLDRRLLPLEEHQMRARAREVEEEIESKVLGRIKGFENMSEENKQKVELKIKNKTMTKLREVIYHWKPEDYNHFKGLLYVYGKLASNFAVLTNVFNEIKKEMPEFEPKSVFDFGSGIGTVTWASNETWPASVKEYFCVDACEDMNNIARLLLQDGKENGDPFLKGVFFRQFLPASTDLKYDMVVCAWSLLELASIQKRLEVIDNLWNRTQHILVLIECGSNAGFSTILEARDYIVNKSLKTGIFGDRKGEVQPVSVISPCPHDLPCPRYSDNSGTPCNFSVNYHKLLASKVKGTATNRYSYVVLRKDFRLQDDKKWPRIVRDVLKRHRHVVCRMCCDNGQLRQVTFTKSKHSKDMYKCARASHWGDLLPATVYETTDEGDIEVTTDSESSESDDEEAVKS